MPLGILKERSKTNTIQFHPPLSEAKRGAIERLGFGVENKVSPTALQEPHAWYCITWHGLLAHCCFFIEIVLQFERAFWPKTPYFQCTDTRFRFLNLDFYGKKGVIIAHVSPPWSMGFDGLDDAGWLLV